MKLEKVDCEGVGDNDGFFEMSPAVSESTGTACCAQEALEILQEFNNLNNDREAYLFSVAEWGLGKIKEKPNPKDYGIT